MSPETVAWLNSLPKPDDAEGWNKRLQDQFASILGTIPQPIVPVSDAELDAEFFGVEAKS